MEFEIPSIIRLSEVPDVAVDIDWTECAFVPEGKVLTFTTIGLRQLGQKELVLCLRQHATIHVNTVLFLFQSILNQAKNGEIVDVNGLTEFGPAGIFDNPDLGGFAYARSHGIDPIIEKLGAETQLDYPQLLSMTLLTRNEVAVMKMFGFARVQSRLGTQQKCFPYPFWNDLERQDAITPEECSKAVAITLKPFPSVFAILENNTVQVYFDSRIRETLRADFAAHPAAAFVTEIAPGTSDGLLVWLADRDGIVINTPRLFAVDENRTDLNSINKLAGCFIVIGKDTEVSQGGIVVEDGFWISLDIEGWITFYKSLLDHEACIIEGRDGCYNFALNWIG